MSTANEINSTELLGVLFKCANGHVWESCVGRIWLQMPTCPHCSDQMDVPAVAWIGKFTEEHQCGGPQEACCIPGCPECGMPNVEVSPYGEN